MNWAVGPEVTFPETRNLNNSFQFSPTDDLVEERTVMFLTQGHLWNDGDFELVKKPRHGTTELSGLIQLNLS